MNIRNWPMDKIMQLPDCCFGRRWPIIFSGHGSVPNVTMYFISEMALPEKCVLWELSTAVRGNFTAGLPEVAYAIRLGDQLPATAAEFVAMEDLLPSCDEIDATARIFRDRLVLRRLRMPIASAGRRLVLRVFSDTLDTWWSMGFVFSSVPTEVPDWLLNSEKASYR